MGTRWDRIKAAFATNSKARAMYERRRGKVEREIDSADKILGTGWTLGLLKELEPWGEALTKVRELRDEARGDNDNGLHSKAYVTLGTAKSMAREVVKGASTVVDNSAAWGEAQEGTFTWVVYQADLARGIRAEGYNDPHGILGDTEIEVVVVLEVPGQIYMKLLKDPLFAAQVHEAASKVGDAARNQGKQLLEAADAAHQSGKRDKIDAAERAVSQWAAETKAQLERPMRVGVQAVVAEVEKKHADYKKYKIKAGVKVTFDIAKITVGVVMLPTSLFIGGATAGIAVWGLMKGAVSLAKKIADLTSTADQAYDHAKVLLKKAKETCEDASKANVMGREVGVRFLKLLGGDTFFLGLTAAGDEIDLARNKYLGVEDGMHAKSELLEKTLAKMDAFRKAIQSAKGISSADFKELDQIEAVVGELLIQIPERIRTAVEREKWCDESKATIVYLQKNKTNEKVLKGIDVTFLVAGLAAGQVAKGFETDWVQIEKAESALESFGKLVGIQST